MPLSNVRDEYDSNFKMDRSSAMLDPTEYEAMKRDMEELVRNGAGKDELGQYAASAGWDTEAASQAIQELVLEGLIEVGDDEYSYTDPNASEQYFEPLEGGVEYGPSPVRAKKAGTEPDLNAMIDQAEEGAIFRILDDHGVPKQEGDPRQILKDFVAAGEIQSWELLDGLKQGPGPSAMKPYSPGETWGVKRSGLLGDILTFLGSAASSLDGIEGEIVSQAPEAVSKFMEAKRQFDDVFSMLQDVDQETDSDKWGKKMGLQESVDPSLPNVNRNDIILDLFVAKGHGYDIRSKSEIINYYREVETGTGGATATGKWITSLSDNEFQELIDEVESSNPHAGMYS